MADDEEQRATGFYMNGRTPKFRGKTNEFIKEDANAVTLTMCDFGEHDVNARAGGVGKMAERGIRVHELEQIKSVLEKKGMVPELHVLSDPKNHGIESPTSMRPSQVHDVAAVLVVPNAVDELVGVEGAADAIKEWIWKQPIDTTVRSMKHKAADGTTDGVVDKEARWNNCVRNGPRRKANTTDIALGYGSMASFDDMPVLNALRNACAEEMHAHLPVAETNYYYDVDDPKVGIGFHGDTERKVVVMARFGKASKRLPISFQWYHDTKRIGDMMTINLNHGDLLVMSEKAVGTDWKRRKICTLRHSAHNLKTGDRKFIKKSESPAGHTRRVLRG